MIINRVLESFDKIEENDFENALIQISIAIDGVAKKKYPKLTTTKRCVKLVEEYKDFIYRFSTCGNVSVKGQIKYSGDFAGKNFGEIFYKVIRCGLLHEGELPQDKSFVFQSGFGIGAISINKLSKKRGFTISSATLISLCFIIIENDLSNAYKNLKINKVINYGPTNLIVDKSTWENSNLTHDILVYLQI